MKYLRLITNESEIIDSLEYGVIYATDDKVFIKEYTMPTVAITRLTYYIPNGGTFPIGYDVPSTAKLNGEVVTFTVQYGQMMYTAPSGGTYTFEFENIGNFSIIGDNYDENYYISSIEIGNDVTYIDDYAFQRCKNLTSITIPDSVTSIGDYAFELCMELTSIIIPNRITSIGHGTFTNCYELSSVTIPNSVTSIDGWAFNQCSSLSSITIPNSVTYIGDSAFRLCTSLASVTYNGTTYTSKSALESALTNNGVSVNTSDWASFDGTALTD